MAVETGTVQRLDLIDQHIRRHRHDRQGPQPPAQAPGSAPRSGTRPAPACSRPEVPGPHPRRAELPAPRPPTPPRSPAPPCRAGRWLRPGGCWRCHRPQGCCNRSGRAGCRRRDRWPRRSHRPGSGGNARPCPRPAGPGRRPSAAPGCARWPARGGAGGALAALAERFEDRLAVGGRHAGAVIDDIDPQDAAAAVVERLDPAFGADLAVGGMAMRVRDQVGKALLQADGVDAHRAGQGSMVRNSSDRPDLSACSPRRRTKPEISSRNCTVRGRIGIRPWLIAFMSVTSSRISSPDCAPSRPAGPACRTTAPAGHARWPRPVPPGPCR